jgi:hypothetical protein
MKQGLEHLRHIRRPDGIRIPVGIHAA